jgi:predicted Zn-dependent protease
MPGGEEVIGETQCTAVLANVCDRFRSTVNGPFIREHYPDSMDNFQLYRDRQMRKTACHELGHTLGLFHYTTDDDRYNNGSTALYTDSCQRSGWTGLTGDAWTRTYEEHHINHIDGWF